MHFDEAYFESVYRNYARQNPPRKMRFYRGLLERNIAGGTSPRILDLGCAFGVFLESLPGEFRKCGVDASEYAIHKAVVRVPDARLAVGDCAAPPFRGPFDAIVAFDVLEHIPDLSRVFDYIDRTLAPEGLLLFVVPVYDGPLGPVIQRLDRDPTHVHKQSRKWWLDQVANRFELIEWTGILRYLAMPGCYVHVPGKAIRGVAPAIAVAARNRSPRWSRENRTGPSEGP